MNLVIETACNQRCSFCFSQKAIEDMHLPKRYSLEETAKVGHWLASQGIKHVNVLGGEPTLHPELPQILDVLKDKGCRPTLVTNGLGEPGAYKESISKVVAVLLNYRPAQEHTQGQRKRFMQNLDSLSREKRNRPTDGPIHLSFGTTLVEVGQSIDYLIEGAKEWGADALRLDLSKPAPDKKNQYLDPRGNQDAGPWLVELVQQILAAGLQPGFDCPVPYCLFSDEQIKYLEDAVHRFRGWCSPPMDILPGGKVIYCYPLAHVCEPVDLEEVGSLDALQKFMGRLVRVAVFKKRLSAQCAQCRWFRAKKCQGFCPSLYDQGSEN
jgi:hypothetical protein